MDVLRRVGRGKYELGQQAIFIPPTLKKGREIYNYIKRSYPLLDICIWHTSCINHFMLHQPSRFNMIVEVERDAEESVFYHLKEKTKNVFLNPSEEVYHNYIAGKRDRIIIKTLISEAPTQMPEKVNVPTLEKILVDIFCDQLIFSPQQGAEMNHIWANAMETYTINFSTLLRYADRRGRKKAMSDYINKLSTY